MESIITNELGGSQSDIKVRFDLIPSEELATVAGILSVGAVKYGENNWHKIPTNDHINHAVAHLYKFLSGDRTENHLGNATCRCLFAMWTNKHSKDKTSLIEESIRSVVNENITLRRNNNG